MTFTRRTYRVTIRRSIQAKREHRSFMERSKVNRLRDLNRQLLDTQAAHTARLKRRKRRERK